MKTVNQIMELADRYAYAAVRDYLSGEGEASHHCDKLRTAIEELAADAARYQWLKDQRSYHYPMAPDSPAECGVDYQWQQGAYEERNWGLNAAIDDEIKRQWSHTDMENKHET